MSWAHLQTQFFTDHPPERELFLRHREAFAWNPQVLPVYEWENQIFIAAANPEELSAHSEAWPSHWVLLKTDPEALQTLWQTWHQPPAELPGDDFVADDANEGQSPSVNTFENNPEMDSTQPRIAVEMNEDTSPPIDMRNLDLVSEKTPPPRAPLPQKPKIPAAIPALTDPAATANDFNPDEFFSQLDAQTGSKAKTVSSEEINFDDGFPTVDESSDDKNENEFGSDPEDASNDGAPEGFEVPEVLVATAPVKIDKPEKVVAKGAVTGKPAASPAVSAPKAPPVAAPKVAPPKAAPAASAPGLKVTPATAKMLSTLPAGYTNAFLATKAGNCLRIIGWPLDYTKSETADTDFSLGTPSPFRICVRTEKPYHGYLISSPMMDQFFAQWNEGKYPEVFTVVPLIRDSTIEGFLLAIGTQQAVGKSNLSAVEKLGVEILNQTPAAPAAHAS